MLWISTPSSAWGLTGSSGFKKSLPFDVTGRFRCFAASEGDGRARGGGGGHDQVLEEYEALSAMRA